MTVMEKPKINRRNQVHLRVHPRLQDQDQAPDQDQDLDLDLGPDHVPGHVLAEDLRRAIQDLGPGNRVNR